MENHIEHIALLYTAHFDKKHSYSTNNGVTEKIKRAQKIVFPTLESCSPNWSSFCCKGVLSGSVAAISSLIFPISVCTPVATTTPIARPAAMFVPYKNTHSHVWRWEEQSDRVISPTVLITSLGIIQDQKNVTCQVDRNCDIIHHFKCNL